MAARLVLAGRNPSWTADFSTLGMHRSGHPVPVPEHPFRRHDGKIVVDLAPLTRAHTSRRATGCDGGLPGDPRVMPPGQAITFTFERPGLYRHQCSFHPQNMQGSVTVGAP